MTYKSNEVEATLRLALEALESCDAAHITDGGHQWYDEKLVDKAIDAIEEALAQPEQRSVSEHLEPVAITITGKLGNIYSFTGDYSLKKGDKVYTTPPQHSAIARSSSATPLKPLTDEQIYEIHENSSNLMEFTRAIEAAHGIKEKNNVSR